MQRRVGQDQADERVAGRDAGGEPGGGPLPHEDDRALDRREQRLLGGVEARQGPRRVEVAHHHRERLLVPPLALAEPPDGLGRRGVAGQVVAAEALDGDDPPRAQVGRGHHERVPPSPSGRPAPLTARRRGPQAGQAIGWAWNRRSRGSSYSRRQAGHIAKPAIVVAGRS